ncbi:hypothetical protein [Nocardioides daejeonensis]|uniref:hypothetical protein n=1 Tax=Nocardioides daejeonensis TaxID=1046556 RepID=UPI000D74BA62|nr:hypothetical protein [Nocardioides daejeonensis]
MIELNRSHLVDSLTARLDTAANGRQRTMLERVVEHAAAERDGDLADLMATLGPATAYHFWEAQGDVGPKGLDGVEAYCLHLVESNGHILEFRTESIVVDDHCIVAEGVLTMIQPGQLMVEHPIAGDFCQADKTYLLRLRNVMLHACPF